jgi:hypothetical protein
LEYWTNVDPDLGKQVKEGVRCEPDRRRNSAGHV